MDLAKNGARLQYVSGHCKTTPNTKQKKFNILNNKEMKSIKDNIHIFIIMTVINFAVLWNYISNGKTLHGISYFIFFYVAILTIHFFTNKIQAKNDIEVKEPKKELIIAIIFAVLGLLFLTLNFMLKSKTLPETMFMKITIIIGNLLFAIPLGLFM
ncbi:MAG: hypothetical protein IT236_15255, partial [Bacteroidia bacterium]|nr:hypothetical protein [Bacteroidia bacterium]